MPVSSVELKAAISRHKEILKNNIKYEEAAVRRRVAREQKIAQLEAKLSSQPPAAPTSKPAEQKTAAAEPPKKKLVKPTPKK